MNSDTFVPRAEVARRLCVHPETLKRWEREGRFPKPVRISRKTVGHLSSTVERFLTGLSGTPIAPAA